MIDDKTRAEWINKVKEDFFVLADADDSIKKDKEIILAAVSNNGASLRFADDSIKKDKEIVLAAISNNGVALRYAGENIKKDKEIVLKTLLKYGDALEYVDNSLKKDKEVVITAVQSEGRAIKYADDTLKKDKEVVLEAVSNNGLALNFAHESLKKDKEILALLSPENKENGIDTKTFHVYYRFKFSPDEYFGKPREKTEKPIIKEGIEHYIFGEEYEVDDEIYVMESINDAYDYLMAKYEADNFDEYDYIEEIEENPYGTDAEEFSNGLGDGSLDIYKIELIDYNSKKVLEKQDF